MFPVITTRCRCRKTGVQYCMFKWVTGKGLGVSSFPCLQREGWMHRLLVLTYFRHLQSPSRGTGVGAVKISPKKDGRRRWPHRCHVYCPTPPRPNPAPTPPRHNHPLDPLLNCPSYLYDQQWSIYIEKVWMSQGQRVKVTASSTTLP